MKNKLNLFSLSVLFLALALVFAPSVRAQQVQPVTPGLPQLTDQEQLIRATNTAGSGGQAIFPNYTLAQEFQLAFSGVQYPQGGYTTSFNPATGVFAIVPYLFTSPVPVLGYVTGAGAGLSVTQLTNKSTTVNFATGTWTGQITMNNASLASATSVLFTVNDPGVAASDVVLLSIQAGTSSGYQVCASKVANNSFVVCVTNLSGGSLSEALTLNFIILRGSGN